MWLPRRANTRNEMSIIGLKTVEGRVRPVDDNSTASSMQVLTETGPERSDIVKDPNDMLLRPLPESLLVRGRLAAVLVGTCLSKHEQLYVGAAIGYLADSMFNRELIIEHEITESWRMIVSPQEREIIAGYGSFERPQIQKQLTTYETTMVTALHVSTTDSIGLGSGFSSRVLGVGTFVYNVLYLEPQGSGKYSRLEVGSIFDVDLQDVMNAAKEEVIGLVWISEKQGSPTTNLQS
jgi:hypothetical protein